MGVLLDDHVDLVKRVLQLIVSVLGRQLKLQDQAIELVQEHDNWLLEAHGFFNKPVDIKRHALYAINNQQHSICQTQRRTHLITEAGVARCINEVEQVVFTARIGHH